MLDFDALALVPNYATFGKAATYTPPVGAAIGCTVIRDNQDRAYAFGDAKPVAEGLKINVRVAEIANPVRGGVFTVGAVRYKVLSDPVCEDPDRLEWSMTAAEI